MVNYHENVYVRRGVDGRDHIPALPFWMAIIRVVQLVCSSISQVPVDKKHEHRNVDTDLGTSFSRVSC
jgi:hypothetical protein